MLKPYNSKNSRPKGASCILICQVFPSLCETKFLVISEESEKAKDLCLHRIKE